MKGLITDTNSPDNTSTRSKLRPIALITVAAAIAGLFTYNAAPFNSDAVDVNSLCPILPLKAPESFYNDNSTALNILNDPKFRAQSAQKLADAVKVDTVVFDNPPEPADNPEYWTKFAKFHDYLASTFPTVHKHLKLTKVNTWGLVYEWTGSDSDLKPVMLTAHQDTVPVQEASMDAWTHPPWEGYYDGKFLFGRGSSDCKNLLVAIMESLELLIAQDFKPKRTILAAFGFDEESGGMIGAKHLAEYLEETYGKDSIYALIDEGFGFTNTTGKVIASPMVGEKGYVNINAKLRTPGGHSSMPPDHTSIGIASELVYLLEKNPFEPILTSANPVLQNLQCLAVNHGDTLPPAYKDAILKAGYDKKANAAVINALQQDPTTRYLVRTSQAVDIINGGEKANALPESVFISINHRIAVESSIKETTDRFLVYAKMIAKKYDLGIVFENETVIDTTDKFGVLTVAIDDNHVEPAVLSPTNDTVWEYLAGASRHLFEDLIEPEADYELVVAPMVMPANTDTRHYHGLTKNIFRYTPSVAGGVNIHSIDEYIEFDSHLQIIAFFYEYLQVIDTKDAEN